VGGGESVADEDNYDWQWQELKLQALLASVDGNAFETLFQNIAKGLWKSDFAPTIPMGSRGDLKCDGFRTDIGALFQCYGPIRGEISTVPFVSIELPSTVEKKIEFNILPQAAHHFLGIGQLGADQVRKYLADKVDPLEAERMVDGFKNRYSELKLMGEEPATAFQQLLIFAGGATGEVEREAAALAIVTYFFSACEIFEQPPED
jgi:hypothetical protein